MQKREIKNRISVGNMNQILKEQLFKDKYIKTALYVVGGVLGLFALGFIFKTVNYTVHNLKNLNATLKR
jgi:hypothetical protein